MKHRPRAGESEPMRHRYRQANGGLDKREAQARPEKPQRHALNWPPRSWKWSRQNRRISPGLCGPIAAFRSLGSYHRDRRACQSQLRRDLSEVTQSADERAGGKFIGNNDLIAGVEAKPLKLGSREQSVHAGGGDDHTIRAQDEGVMHVGGWFSLARQGEIDSR